MIAIPGPEKRGDSDDWIKRIDFSSIAFPSDRISIKTLRGMLPEAFDVGFADRYDEYQPKYFLSNQYHNHRDKLGGLLYCERLVAAFAYSKIRGVAMPDYGEFTEDDAVSDLKKRYMQFGLAKGRHECNELVHNVQEQARQLAGARER